MLGREGLRLLGEEVQLVVDRLGADAVCLRDARQGHLVHQRGEHRDVLARLTLAQRGPKGLRKRLLAGSASIACRPTLSLAEPVVRCWVRRRHGGIRTARPRAAQGRPVDERRQETGQLLDYATVALERDGLLAQEAMQVRQPRPERAEPVVDARSSACLGPPRVLHRNRRRHAVIGAARVLAEVDLQRSLGTAKERIFRVLRNPCLRGCWRRDWRYQKNCPVSR